METRARCTGTGAAMLGILLLFVFFAANVHAQLKNADLQGEKLSGSTRFVNDVPAASAFRLEATVGGCKHRLADDASWHYEYGGYETNMKLNPTCYQVGISYLPYNFDGVDWGYRASYVDLGTVTADNSFPIDEKAYFRAKDSGTPVQSPTGRFQGRGSARGFTFGLAAEEERFGLRLGAEVGLAVLRRTWHVNFPGFGSAVLLGCRDDWACADSTHATYYFGVNARYKYLFVSVRQYANAHASQAHTNPLFIGPTTGPVTQITAGFSVAL